MKNYRSARIFIYALGFILLSIVLPRTTQAFTLAPGFCHSFTYTPQFGTTNDEVIPLRQILAAQGFLTNGDLSDPYFDQALKTAVILFQQKYASAILTPNKLTRGNGLLGPATRAKLNTLYGCLASAAPTTAPIRPSTVDFLRLSSPQTIRRNDSGQATMLSLTMGFRVNNNYPDPLFISHNPSLALATISNLDTAGAFISYLSSPDSVPVNPDQAFYVGPGSSRAFSADIILINAGNPNGAVTASLIIPRILFSTSTPDIQSPGQTNSIYTSNLRVGPITIAN